MLKVTSADNGAAFIVGGGETGALMRSIDWRDTLLGPASAWPQSLRTSVDICVSSRFPIAVYWGSSYVMLYNDDLIPMVGANKHPHALGRPAFEVLPEIRAIIEPLLDRVVSTGEAIWSEDLMLPLLRAQGQTESYFTFTYSPIRDESGGVAGVFCAVLETTDKIIEERRLRLLHALADVTDAKTPAQACELAAQQLARVPNDVPFALLYLLEADAHRFELAGAANIEPGSGWAPRAIDVGNHRLWSFDPATPNPGREVTLEAAPAGARGAVIRPLARAGGGQPLGFIVLGLSPMLPSSESYERFQNLLEARISQGVSNAAAYEAERRRAEALAELDRAKTTFFSNVSHEFRTPLTLMLAPIQDLVNAPTGAPVDRGSVELLHRNALRLLKLVNTLLDFSRIQSGRLTASFEPVDLAGLTMDLVSNFRDAIERAGLTLVMRCEPLAQPVYVDRDMWEKIVLNLLSNALKYTFDGTITVRLESDDRAATLRVQDTGIGIAEHDIPRLFERFHRIHGARARSQEGSGIGLAFVQELVRLHDGAISVASKLCEGTSFTVQVPLGRAHLPKDHVRDAPTPSVSTDVAAEAFVREALRWAPPHTVVAVQEADLSPGRERVLFADDNADMREYVTRLLEERWSVETVQDGLEALASIKRSPPDLVLCDVMMPGLDGFGLIKAVRSEASLATIPVIVLSARAGEEASAEGLRAGADDYIVKPFSARDLLVRVASKLVVARMGREVRELEHAQRVNLYRHFMQAPFPIAVFKGPTHIVELANDQTLAAWRRGPEIIGRPLAQALPELHDQPFLGWLDQVFESGETHEGKEQMARLSSGPDGALEEVYFNFVYAPLHDPRGQVEGVLLSAFIVTDQVLARQAIEQALARAESSEARLQAAQRTAKVGIFEWSLLTQSVTWSPEIFGLMGIEPGAVTPSPEAWTETLVESDREKGWSAFHDAVAKRAGIMETELRLRQPDGSARWVRLSAEIRYDDGGTPIELLGAVIDVQLLKEAAEVRQRALEEAERVSRAKDEFLATMSHELRTPLHAMLGWVKLLQRPATDEKRLRHGLNVIARNAEAQARLISDLLDVSRIISGKLRLSTAVVSVVVAVNAALDVVRPAADARGVQLLAQLDPETGSIVGDPDRLQQIVWNLLSNAIKFTPAGGCVTVRAARRNSSVSIDVEDTGAGIAGGDLAVIFNRFQQVDSSTTRMHGGLGLGLAIVRNLTEAHGGTVTAFSPGLGMGTRFNVVLPVHAVFASSEPAGLQAAEDARMTTPRNDTGRLAGSRILVVDDETDSLELLRFVLEEAGATVWTANSAGAALANLENQRFDALVSDIGMPEMDGHALIRTLRAQTVTLPALALTAYARAEDAALALKAGFQEHLEKPVDAEKLVSVLAQLLAKTPR